MVRLRKDLFEFLKSHGVFSELTPLNEQAKRFADFGSDVDHLLLNGEPIRMLLSSLAQRNQLSARPAPSLKRLFNQKTYFFNWTILFQYINDVFKINLSKAFIQQISEGNLDIVTDIILNLQAFEIDFHNRQFKTLSKKDRDKETVPESENIEIERFEKAFADNIFDPFALKEQDILRDSLLPPKQELIHCETVLDLLTGHFCHKLKILPSSFFVGLTAKYLEFRNCIRKTIGNVNFVEHFPVALLASLLTKEPSFLNLVTCVFQEGLFSNDLILREQTSDFFFCLLRSLPRELQLTVLKFFNLEAFLVLFLEFMDSEFFDEESVHVRLLSLILTIDLDKYIFKKSFFGLFKHIFQATNILACILPTLLNSLQSTDISLFLTEMIMIFDDEKLMVNKLACFQTVCGIFAYAPKEYNISFDDHTIMDSFNDMLDVLLFSETFQLYDSNLITSTYNNKILTKKFLSEQFSQISNFAFVFFAGMINSPSFLESPFAAQFFQVFLLIIAPNFDNVYFRAFVLPFVPINEYSGTLVELYSGFTADQFEYTDVCFIQKLLKAKISNQFLFELCCDLFWGCNEMLLVLNDDIIDYMIFFRDNKSFSHINISELFLKFNITYLQHAPIFDFMVRILFHKWALPEKDFLRQILEDLDTNTFITEIHEQSDCEQLNVLKQFFQIGEDAQDLSDFDYTVNACPILEVESATYDIWHVFELYKLETLLEPRPLNPLLIDLYSSMKDYKGISITMFAFPVKMTSLIWPKSIVRMIERLFYHVNHDNREKLKKDDPNNRMSQFVTLSPTRVGSSGSLTSRPKYKPIPVGASLNASLRKDLNSSRLSTVSFKKKYAHVESRVFDSPRGKYKYAMREEVKRLSTPEIYSRFESIQNRVKETMRTNKPVFSNKRDEQLYFEREEAEYSEKDQRRVDFIIDRMEDQQKLEMMRMEEEECRRVIVRKIRKTTKRSNSAKRALERGKELGKKFKEQREKEKSYYKAYKKHLKQVDSIKEEAEAAIKKEIEAVDKRLAPRRRVLEKVKPEISEFRDKKNKEARRRERIKQKRKRQSSASASFTLPDEDLATMKTKVEQFRENRKKEEQEKRLSLKQMREKEKAKQQRDIEKMRKRREKKEKEKTAMLRELELMAEQDEYSYTAERKMRRKLLKKQQKERMERQKKRLEEKQRIFEMRDNIMEEEEAKRKQHIAYLIKKAKKMREDDKEFIFRHTRETAEATMMYIADQYSQHREDEEELLRRQGKSLHAFYKEKNERFSDEFDPFAETQAEQEKEEENSHINSEDPMSEENEESDDLSDEVQAREVSPVIDAPVAPQTVNLPSDEEDEDFEEV
ncbi:hypothetical protein PCE1_004565 [Barthelona sp. PCE]